MTSPLQRIIVPVLEGMADSILKEPLLAAFRTRERPLSWIEDGFRRLTERRHDVETLRRFFHSWSQTNNSAMTVAGIGNRLTLLARSQPALARDPDLLNTVVSLGRIVDEDLAVTHKVLHSQMYYTMATGIVGDDLWLSQRYLVPEAREFKRWKDHNSLRESDLTLALLTTLVHEIYTHGEVEFILPLFRRWLRDHFDCTERESTRLLGWISVHCGPTEKNHFFHALDAVGHYARLTGVDLHRYAIDQIARTYLDKKSAVLRALLPCPTEAAA